MNFEYNSSCSCSYSQGSRQKITNKSKIEGESASWSIFLVLCKNEWVNSHKKLIKHFCSSKENAAIIGQACQQLSLLKLI